MYQGPLLNFTGIVLHYLNLVLDNYDQCLRLVLIDIISKFPKIFHKVLLLSIFICFNSICILIYKETHILKVYST